MNSKLLCSTLLIFALTATSFAQNCRTQCGQYLADYQAVCEANSDESVSTPQGCNCDCRCPDLCVAYVNSYERYTTTFGSDAFCNFPSICDCSSFCPQLCDDYTYCREELSEQGSFDPDLCPLPTGCSC